MKHFLLLQCLVLTSVGSQWSSQIESRSSLPAVQLVTSSSPISRERERCSTRSKRYAIEGSYWGVNNVTYRISRHSRRLSRKEADDVLRRAFHVWEENTNLSFLPTDKSDAHINILFAEDSHGDGEPFDGSGGILAHAFFPRYGGAVHFDDAEPWSSSRQGGRDLYIVAVHEIGHALGLKHSQNDRAVMAPFYQRYTGNRIQLHKDDIHAIARLYGPNGAMVSRLLLTASSHRATPLMRPILSRVTASKSRIHEEEVPDLCSSPSIDAITRLGNGTLYVFKGEHFWQLREEGGFQRGYPRRIVQFWPFPPHIDAILTDSEGDSYVFKGGEYWLLGRRGDLMAGYPRHISEGLVDTPDDLDAAFVWHRDNQPYFFKKDRYWRYSRFGLDELWPKKISTIFRKNNKLQSENQPDRVDAALNLSPNESFLFSGTKYYKVTGFRWMRVAAGYPKLTADYWFGCDKKTHLIK